jgi:hypothetical protein
VTKMTAEENAAERSRNETYRSQAKGEYEEKRDEGRLRAALRTRATLDDARGVQVCSSSQSNIVKKTEIRLVQCTPTEPDRSIFSSTSLVRSSHSYLV